MGEREIADRIVGGWLASHPDVDANVYAVERDSLVDSLATALRQRAAEALEKAARDIVSREKNESPAEFLYARAARLREGRG